MYDLSTLHVPCLVTFDRMLCTYSVSMRYHARGDVVLQWLLFVVQNVEWSLQNIHWLLESHHWIPSLTLVSLYIVYVEPLGWWLLGSRSPLRSVTSTLWSGSRSGTGPLDSWAVPLYSLLAEGTLGSFMTGHRGMDSFISSFGLSVLHTVSFGHWCCAKLQRVHCQSHYWKRVKLQTVEVVEAARLNSR